MCVFRAKQGRRFFMVIFNKKRILFFISCLVISFIGLNINNNKNLETVQTSATPVSGYTIVLDAGHGYPDGGAVSDSRSI